MKNILKTLLLIFFLMTSITAQEKEIQQAEKLYKENSFQQAASIYHSLIDSGYNDAKLYYNLGNSYYRMGNIGFAILYYEKAHKLAPNDEDISHNLMFANSKKPVKEEKLPDFFLTTIVNNIASWMSFTGWFILTNILFIALLVSIGYYFLSNRNNIQRIAFFGSIMILLILLFTSGLTYAKYNLLNDTGKTILIVQSADLKSEPDYSSKNLTTIYEGIKLDIQEEVQEWIKVKLPDGKTGWIEKNYTATI